MKRETLPIEQTREISPCRGCSDRHIACHDKCEKYKAWKSQLEEVNKRSKEYEARPFVQYNPFDY